MVHLLAASPESDGSLKGDLSLGFLDEEQDNTIARTTFGEGLHRVFIRGDILLAQVEDEAGTIMVKRYRVALPGEEGAMTRAVAFLANALDAFSQLEI